MGSFFDLPPEIRNAIYEYYLSALEVAYLDGEDMSVVRVAADELEQPTEFITAVTSLSLCSVLVRREFPSMTTGPVLRPTALVVEIYNLNLLPLFTRLPETTFCRNFITHLHLRMRDRENPSRHVKKNTLEVQQLFPNDYAEWISYNPEIGAISGRAHVTLYQPDRCDAVNRFVVQNGERLRDVRAKGYANIWWNIYGRKVSKWAHLPRQPALRLTGQQSEKLKKGEAGGDVYPCSLLFDEGDGWLLSLKSGSWWRPE